MAHFGSSVEAEDGDDVAFGGALGGFLEAEGGVALFEVGVAGAPVGAASAASVLGGAARRKTGELADRRQLRLGFREPELHGRGPQEREGGLQVPPRVTRPSVMDAQ